MASELKTFLIGNGMYPTQEEKKDREKAIAYLSELIELWGKNVYISKTGAAQDTDVCAAKIFTYGSYRLDVYGNDADIDICVVSNSSIERDDFFKELYAFLLNNADVKEIHQVPSKMVPILTLNYMKIDIDLNFAQTSYSSLPKDIDVLNDNILNGMDEQSIRSINGRRNTDMVNKFIPEHSEEAFKIMVRSIKLWSKRRGVYGYVFCYLNGISIEIMVARVISENYQLDNVRLLEKFFQVYYSWDWARNPVMLGANEERPERKKDETVQIITPATPRENSLHSMTKSSLELLRREMKRGERIVHEFSSEGGNDWNKLFKKRHLFCGYYIFIEFTVKSVSLSVLTATIKKFESTLAKILGSLNEIDEILEANAIPNGFLDEENEIFYYYIGMNVKKDRPIDISTPLNSFLDATNKGKDFAVDASIKKRSEIPLKFAHAVKKVIHETVAQPKEVIQKEKKTESETPTNPPVQQKIENIQEIKQEMKQEASKMVVANKKDEEFLKRFKKVN